MKINYRSLLPIILTNSPHSSRAPWPPPPKSPSSTPPRSPPSPPLIGNVHILRILTRKSSFWLTWVELNLSKLWEKSSSTSKFFETSKFFTVVAILWAVPKMLRPTWDADKKFTFTGKLTIWNYIAWICQKKLSFSSRLATKRKVLARKTIIFPPLMPQKMYFSSEHTCLGSGGALNFQLGRFSILIPDHFSLKFVPVFAELECYFYLRAISL